jgi:hypothetical protein
MKEEREGAAKLYFRTVALYMRYQDQFVAYQESNPASCSMQDT